MLSMFIWLSKCYTEVNGKKKNDIMVISKAPILQDCKCNESEYGIKQSVTRRCSRRHDLNKRAVGPWCRFALCRVPF